MYIALDLFVFFFPIFVIVLLVFSLNSSDSKRVILPRYAAYLSRFSASICLMIFGVLTLNLHSLIQFVSAEEFENLRAYKALHLMAIFIVMYLQGFKNVTPQKK